MGDSQIIAPATSEPPVVIQTAGGAIPRAVSSNLLTHGGITIPNFFAMHVTGACFPLVAGLLLYGWRAAASIAVVLITAAVAVAIWRKIGWRGGQLRFSHSLWLALLLGLTLPPHLFTDALPTRADQTIAAWPLLPAAALIIVPLIWFLGGLGTGRLHPVLLANLLLMTLFGHTFQPHYTLQRTRIIVGDVMDISKTDPDEPLRGRWISAPPVAGHDAMHIPNLASNRLIEYTTSLHRPQARRVSLETLIRDAMPPIEDLIVGGHPGPIGTSCQIAVIIGGLFMLYRGVIDYRIPLLIIVSAYAIILAMIPRGAGAALAVTFANYEVMASPLLFTAFFLATSTAIRPLARRARVLYAIFVGVTSALAQWYLSVSVGPYLALLVAGVFAAALDRF